jgi:hypothetical protein
MTPPLKAGRAEAVVTFSPRAAAGEARAAARSLGVECEFRPGSIRILANSTGTGMDALRAAADAALALIAALKDDSAMIESVRLAPDEKARRSRAARSPGKSRGPRS